mmetsp:Transcript_18178/g.39630  ORF Transcript_18178/g.39630 Transcript_18178/m.39630 type:complete len:209 (+) Transcript_18178:117-743(+)
MNIDEVAIPDRSDPLFVNLDDLSSMLLDGKVVFQNRSVNLPVVISFNLDDKVVANYTNGSLLDFSNFVAVSIFNGHGVANAQLTFLDLVQSLSSMASLEVEGLTKAKNLVVCVIGGPSLSSSTAHLVDSEIITEGEKLFPHGKGLLSTVIIGGAITIAATTVTFFVRLGSDTGSYDSSKSSSTSRSSIFTAPRSAFLSSTSSHYGNLY